jgi:hypothetical protein
MSGSRPEGWGSASIGLKIFSESNKDIYVTIRKLKLQHVNVVTFRSEHRMRHEYTHWRDVSEKNVFKE